MALERGILDLISMFLARPNDQFELIITGYGSLKNIVEDYSERYKDIHYIGNLSEKRYVEVLDQSTICINSQIPSIYLNFPSKITHYLSHGKMVMSTKGASVIKSEFYPLIQFYNYSDITSFWNAVNKILSIDMNDILETRLHLFNKIFNEMDRRLIDYLEITTA